jgi:predicted Kef-type K+ transport protein
VILFKFKKLLHDQFGGASIGQIIMVVITVVIALALTPIVTSSVNDAANDTSGAAATVINLVPLFYVVGILLTALVWVVSEARKAGG